MAMFGSFGVIIGLALAAVFAALTLGIFSMTRGGEFNARYGNKLMRLRVLLQGLAIVLFILLVVTSSRG